ncbi:hypothetical protein L3X38_006284 [Prunus dulcis]|uniref:F-box domain-containing protein n=1 Tax=Prunus dulcis TaxID=3755 RepID=A0AAD4ZSP1_PRUDU|nr:hypothetical protein L3X38_006284 [Prunus dulcis]
MVVTSSTFLSGEWASLPLPVVFFVLDKMLEPIDHVHFAAVCKEWRALAKDYNHATQRWRQLLPMLMIPTRSQEIKRRMYSVAEGKMYNIELPVPYNDKQGWIQEFSLQGSTSKRVKTFYTK